MKFFEMTPYEIDDYLLFGELPSHPRSFIQWRPNTFQINLFSEKLVAPVPQEYNIVFMPLDYWKDRIVMGSRLTSLDPVLKSKVKTLVAGVQYQIDGDTAYIHFMATKPKWRRKGVMTALMKYIQYRHRISNFEFDSTTKDGEKFVKGIKL